MFYRKKTYDIVPDKLGLFNGFFHKYLYPNQMKHGAKLVGRWVNETETEITAIWEYRSEEHYRGIEESIRKTEMHFKAQEKRAELGKLFYESKEEFLTPTGNYKHPMHIVSVSGYITNKSGEVLLVKNYHRSDTYEMPGGQVEEGECLETAIHREIIEETGVTVKLAGITGIYQNVTSGIVCVVFRGEFVSGTPRPAEGETKEVFFQKLNEQNIDDFVTRPQFKSRVLDARDPNYIPCETFEVRPYELINRTEVIKESN